MDFLCLNCGKINEENANNRCIICETINNNDQYNKVIDYSKRAVHYGYNYRRDYEEQTAVHGKVTTKYSLLDPNSYYEWLAAAVISGMVGNFVYDLVKHVAVQIYNKLMSKQQDQPLSREDTQLLELVSNNKNLTVFISYIQRFYKGKESKNDEVRWAVREEEIIHAILENGDNDKIVEIMTKQRPEGEDPLEDFGDLFIQGAKLAGKKRLEKPNLIETKQLFKQVKKQLKEQKKANKRRRATS